MACHFLQVIRTEPGRLPMIKFLLTAVLLAGAVASANAQVSLDELDKAVSARDKELEQFSDRLNDPDPEKSLAVMKLLIEKGDADQRRMAIRFGLYSPDLAVRSTVLRAIFNSFPTIVVKMTPVNEEQNKYFHRDLKNLAASYSGDGSVSVTYKITGYDEEAACWFFRYNGRNTCLLRLTADTVSVYVVDSWSQYTLNTEGVLVGSQNVQGEITKATISLAE